MAWSEEQDSILIFWAGKVPSKVLADFLSKNQFTVASRAGKFGLSLSFFGVNNSKPYDEKRKTVDEMLCKKQEMTNRAIAKVAGVKESYVANRKRALLKQREKPIVRDVIIKESDNVLLNNVFN